ncbi:MAG: alpha/beta hydrolase fold domain-containing protein [Gallionella sp.]|nr:alpha/beta hydrolase fold domain-containing protein [Gallionella sp.]
MTAILSHITRDTGKNPGYSIIWLHGLGADGQDFVPVAEELKLPVAVRYIFPHAPVIPVTINGGFAMRAWYDIVNNDIGAQQDAAGIHDSKTAIDALIGQEIGRGIAPDHLFLAGFSQGGAIALHTALRQDVALGGVLALSAYLPLAQTVASEASVDSRKTPVFMAHGRQDPVVPCALGLASKEALQASGYQVSWHEYAMQHSVIAQELQDIKTWLTNRIEVKGEG